MTAKEFALLRLLVECPGEVISRDQFLDIVWGYTAFPTTRTVDRHVASLRGKIEDDPNRPRFIHTVHAAGYRFEPPLP
jgi:DNA-binding response OmpR family regulator